MSEKITVAVSYFYQGESWTDTYTKIKFKKSEAGYPIEISKIKDLTGIKRSLRLNNLVLVEGTLDTTGENSLDNIDPSELTNEQLKELAGSGGDTEVLEQEIVQLKKDKTTLQAENTQLGKDKTALETKVTSLEADKVQLGKDKTALEGQISTLQGQVGTLTTEKDTAVTGKNKMYKLHVFTEEELADTFFTAAVLKDILTVKEITFGASDSKAELTSKLLAGQAPE